MAAISQPKTQGNAITQDSRALWLMLRNDGGWWTVNQLVHHWRPTYQAWELEELLSALQGAGFLERRSQGPGHLTWGVTSACLPLPGLSLLRDANQERRQA